MVESSTDHPRCHIPLSHCRRISSGRIICMPRIILATTLMAVCLVTPDFVTSSAKGSLTISRGTIPTSKSHRSVILSSLFQEHRIPRGGAVGVGRNKASKGSLYLKALDDEILWLEQQVRRVEQEKRSLKKKLANRQQVREARMESKGKDKAKREKDRIKLDKEREEDLLRLANLEQLEKQKESLLTAKGQLESIKLDYDQKLQALQSDLLKSRSRNDNLEKTFLARVKELEISLKKVREAAAKSKLNTDPDLSRKIHEACQVAITEFWVEGNRRLKEHEQQLKARYEQELLEERRLATLAVDKQRQKMRALAKATAIREKEIAAKAKLLSYQQSQSGIPSKNAKQKHPASAKQDEKLEREKLKTIKEEAERKAKEEEERMWLELESELAHERERLQRMKQREEEEQQRCEQEERERRRLLQQHAVDMEERLRKEQQQAASRDFGGSRSNGLSLFGRVFGASKKNKKPPLISQPTIASIENFQRRVMWQPITLPPKEAVQIMGPKQSD